MIETALVLGGGIGGLACATALAQQGVSVKLYEQASEIAEVGAGLQISPNGLSVLEAMGLHADLLKSGAVPAQAVNLEDFRDGTVVARLDLKRLAERSYLFVHRADLIFTLLGAAERSGVDVRLGARAVQVVPGSPPHIVFTSGMTDTADVIICADGLHSVGRSVLTGALQACFTGQVAWRATVPADNPEPRVSVSMGPGRHIVRYPLRGGSLMNLVAVQEREAWAAEGWAHQDDPENLRQAFSDFGGEVRQTLDAVEAVNLWGLFRHPVAETWTRDGVVLIGDAAHPTLPFLAQGANLALEDAWLLARVVGAGVELARYQDMRRSRVENVVDAASKNAWKYHMQPGPLRWAAHRALSLGSRVAPGAMMRQFDWIYGYDATRVAL